MSLAAKLKTSLDEARTLILGAQILLGFQYQGAFQERFEQLSSSDRVLDALALVLLVASVGLLIAPSSYHRIAEHGRSSGRMQFLTSRLAALALVPFAIGLGLDLTITLGRVWGSFAGSILAGAAFTFLALGVWFGLGKAMGRSEGAVEREKAEAERGETEAVPLHSRIDQMLTEARVILPGAQATLGFQLAIVLTSAFEKLSHGSKLIHGGALLCVALAVILLMTPAALHRIVWAGQDSEAEVRLGGRIVMLSLAPLGLGLSADGYVVLTRITESTRLGASAAVLMLLCLAGLWYVWPLIYRAQAASRPSQPG